MIHRPSQGASQRLEPRPEPVSSSGDEQRCYTTARDTIHGNADLAELDGKDDTEEASTSPPIL